MFVAVYTSSEKMDRTVKITKLVKTVTVLT